MPLNLVGKLHRTVYISNCPENAEEDFVLLLMKKCGAIEAWDVSDDGKRITVIFQSINSMSNALLFNGMTFLDATNKIVLWKATEKPPLEASSQLAITSRHDAQSASSHKRKRYNKENVQEEVVDVHKTNKHNEHDMSTNDSDDDDIEEKQKEEVRNRRVTDRAERRAALHSTLLTSSSLLSSSSPSTAAGVGVSTLSSGQGTTVKQSNGNAEISHGSIRNDEFVDDEKAYYDKMKELSYRQLKALCTLTANSLNNVQEQISELRKVVAEQQQVELQIEQQQEQEQEPTKENRETSLEEELLLLELTNQIKKTELGRSN